MIELTNNFGTLTANRTSKISHVSNPISNSFNATSNAFAEQSKDKREYNVVENAVAYANPFSFESLFGGSDNSTVSAFDA